MNIFNIGKANARITELEGQLSALSAENASLKENAPQIEAAAEAMRNELAQSKDKLTHAEADLSTAKQSIASVTAEKDRVTAELAEANKKLANPAAQIKESASAQAAAIVAQVGHSPLGVTPATGTGNTAEKSATRSQFSALNPRARAEFIKAGGRVTE